ncbi:MinD/ParA family ATP-binding protein [Nonomuraea sp. LPB2021202275-12-8]|uniref:MinD/ParA family ATP-binding protein n=1 Tax=Nonomuraea sp. LPB2021202275-12-8 TaxID=3120159 RepID=UPI00300C992D
MTLVLTPYSPRGGTGKSHLVANIAVVAAMSGKRVAILDTALQSPCLDVMFNLAGGEGPTLTDYLLGSCEILETAHDKAASVTCDLDEIGGALFVVPSCRDERDAAQVLSTGYDPGLLVDGCRRLIEALQLDLLLLDTPPGLSSEAVICVRLAHTIIVVERPDALHAPRKPYSPSSMAQGADVRVVVNMVPELMSEEEVLRRTRSAYDFAPDAILRYTPELAALDAGGVFVCEHPDSPLSARLRELTDRLVPTPLPVRDARVP